ncbi:MAG: adenylate/guanylate cyclase domain-containing protein, partial [Marmoricola sp.]
ETALAPLRARRNELETPRSEQRRLVTVVFADLVDFTVLSRQLDAEDTREVVGAYFARWQRAIEDQGGVVEKFIGDAVMAVYGLSRSYEDDAHRAVRSALAMLRDLETLNADVQRRYGVTLHMRVGIDTGEVVVSTLDERRGMGFVAVGPTVNRASRLQAAAPVDGILVSRETRRQIRGAFGMDERPGLQLKGIDEPVDAWVVRSERNTGFQIDRVGGVEGVETSTVGRDLQLRFLQDRLFDVTHESSWRLVTVLGDAGVGKSRLLFDYDAWLAERAEPVWWFRGRASPYTQNTVNGLLRDVVTSRLGIQVDDTTDSVRRALTEGFTAALGPDEGPRSGALVGAWLGFDTDTAAFELPSDPQALRDQGTELLGRYFHVLSQQVPVVILLEDLHWADEGTLRWLDAVSPELSDATVLVVATTRPSLLESRPRWGEGLSHHVRLPLSPLSRRESRELIAQLLSRVPDLPDSLADLVMDAAEGNPFYIEELVTWLLDAGVVVRGEPDWWVVDELVHTVAVPSTLKGVLQSRLDALSAQERDLLQRASVVGRVFWDQAVAHIGDEPDGADEQATLGSLDSLRRREVLLQREVSRFANAREFLFKHALLRDVAYDGVLRAQRERYHRGAAQWLAETSAAVGREDEYAAVIAEHYERAHDPTAATWYLRAGRGAASVYALDEADRMLTSAVKLVDPSDLGLRFDVLAAREALLDRTGRRDEQHAVLEEMAGLEPDLDPARRVQLLLAQSRVAFVHSDYDSARALAGEAVQLSTAIHRDDLRAETTLWQGKALTWAEDPDAARSCLTLAVQLARAAGRPTLVGEGLRYLSMVASNVGDYPASLDLAAEARDVFARDGDTEMESAALAQRATTFFNMGRYEEAQASLEETLPIFRRSGHRYREAVNLGNLASVALMRGRLAESRQWAAEATVLTRELEEREASATYVLVHGAVDTFTGRFAEGDAQLEEALEVARDVGAQTLEVDLLARMTTSAVLQRDHERALSRAREAVEVSRTTQSDLDRGHAHLGLGYAALAAGKWDEAEQGFDEATTFFSGLHLATRESITGLAAVALARGDVARASALVEPLLAHLDVEGLSGTVLPGEMLRTCHRILVAAGDPRADTVLAQARAYLEEYAAGIGDEEMAAGFLSVPVHRELLDGHRADV